MIKSKVNKDYQINIPTQIIKKLKIKEYEEFKWKINEDNTITLIFDKNTKDLKYTTKKSVIIDSNKNKQKNNIRNNTMKFNIDRSVDDILAELQDNKKEFYGNESGIYSFKGAGEKTLMLEGVDGKEWIKWEDIDIARREILKGMPVNKLGITGNAVEILYNVPKNEDVDYEEEIMKEIIELYKTLSKENKNRLLSYLKEN